MNRFRLAEPQNLRELLGLLAKPSGSSLLLAGGTDLIGMLKDGLLNPDIVIDLSNLKEMTGIKQDKDGVHIGALTTLNELASDPVIDRSYSGLRQAAISVGSPQLRNVGTVGGNLGQRPRCWYFRDPLFPCRKKGGSRCYAAKGRNKYHAILGGGICHIVHPSDLAPALISLDARVRIVSASGEKQLPLSEFFILPSVQVRKENVLGPDEVLTEIIIPRPPARLRSTYLKFTERGSWDFAVVSVAVAGIFEGKSLANIHVVLGGVAPIPWRLAELEKKLQGEPLSEKTVATAAAEALKGARPLEENSYKVDLAGVLITRAVMSLVA